MEFSLYLITDRRLVDDLPQAVGRALSGIPRGAAAVQLREKDLSARELLELSRALLPLCRARDTPLLINDRFDVALAAGLDGVHLAGGSLPAAVGRALLGPGRWIGASCHDPKQLRERAGADFATFSPIFPSPGKGPAIGVESLADAVMATDVPLFALGGVDVGNVQSCITHGARGVAAIGAWLARGDPAEATAALYQAVLSTSDRKRFDSTGSPSDGG